MEESEIVKTILENISFLKNCWDWFQSFLKEIKENEKKGTESRVIFPKNQENFKKIILNLEKLKTIPNVNKINELKNFFEKYEIIEVEGQYGIVSRDATTDILISTVKRSKQIEREQEINLIPAERAKNYAEFGTSPKYVKRSISERSKALNMEYKSLLSLAIYLNGLYEQERFEEIAKIKASIKDRYGEEGLTFCNCYIKGYIERVIDAYPKYKINKKLDWLLKKPIFFIYSNMELQNIKEIKNNLKNSITTEEEYVAIHGLGNAVPIAKSIVADIQSSVKDDETNHESITIDTEKLVKVPNGKKKIKEFNKVWYLGKGRILYSLVEDIL